MSARRVNFGALVSRTKAALTRFQESLSLLLFVRLHTLSKPALRPGGAPSKTLIAPHLVRLAFLQTPQTFAANVSGRPKLDKLSRKARLNWPFGAPEVARALTGGQVKLSALLALVTIVRGLSSRFVTQHFVGAAQTGRFAFLEAFLWLVHLTDLISVQLCRLPLSLCRCGWFLRLRARLKKEAARLVAARLAHCQKGASHLHSKVSPNLSRRPRLCARRRAVV